MFNTKIWAKKVAISAVEIAVVGGASIWAGNAWLLALLPVLEAVRNYWKHK